ncbi:MAG: class I SAM-dependent methyltransferase [Acidimicrobiales bacterium]
MDRFTASSYGDGFADVYDEWYADVTDVQATVRCVAKLAPQGRVLELGAGTGRIALELAAKHQVACVDSSQAMLNRLSQKPGAEKVTVLCADMAEQIPEGPFDLALATYNTFFSLACESAQLQCLRLVHEQLIPGGLLVLENFVPASGAESEPARVSPRSVTADEVILSVTQPGQEPQQLEGQFIQISEKGIRLRPWSIRFLRPDQLDDLCARSGFSLVHRWSDWHGRPMTEESAQQIAVYGRV